MWKIESNILKLLKTNETNDNDTIMINHDSEKTRAPILNYK